MNAAVSALRFFFQVTLGRAGFGACLAATRSPERLPVVLSTDEVARLLGCAPGRKYQAALSAAYGCGLRCMRSSARRPISKSPPPPRTLPNEAPVERISHSFSPDRIRSIHGSRITSPRVTRAGPAAAVGVSTIGAVRLA